MELLDRSLVIEALEKERLSLLDRKQYSTANLLMHYVITTVCDLPVIQQPEIVRCKDCRDNNQCSIQFKFADADNPGEWFCAYGKRK